MFSAGFEVVLAVSGLYGLFVFGEFVHAAVAGTLVEEF